jgi:hypothetical protein
MSIVKVTIEWILRLVGRAARAEGPWEHPARTSMCLTYSQIERHVRGLLDLPADLASHVAEACRYCSLVKALGKN